MFLAPWSRSQLIKKNSTPFTFLVVGREQLSPLDILTLNYPSSKSSGINVILAVDLYHQNIERGSTEEGNKHVKFFCPTSNTFAHLPNSTPAVSLTSLQKPSNLSVSGRALMQRNLPNTRPPVDVVGI